MKKHITRRAPHMEKFTEIRCIKYSDEPAKYYLTLKVDNQSFQIDSGVCYYDTRKEVNWVRDMLCIALDEMVKKCNTSKI